MSRSMEPAGIVDVSPERHRIDIYVPQTSDKRWENETSFYNESNWKFFLRVFSAGGRCSIGAKIGIKLRGEDATHPCISLRVISGRREIPLESNGTHIVPDLRQYINRRNRLKLVLLISPVYKELINYMARNIVILPSSFTTDLTSVLRGDNRDIKLVCRDNRHALFHSAIVGVRAPKLKENVDWWPQRMMGQAICPIDRSEWILDVWNVVLSYLYTDTLPPVSDNLRTELEVLRWAYHFDNERLLNLMELRLAKVLNPTNILAISTFCYRNCNEQILQLQEVMQAFMNIPSKRYSTIKDLVKPPYRRWFNKVSLNFMDIVEFILRYNIVDEAISLAHAEIRVDRPNERLLRTLINKLESGLYEEYTAYETDSSDEHWYF